MTPEQFAYWFNGFAEMTPEPPSAAQWQMMREHAASVFDKETPPLLEETPRSRRLSYPVAEVREILRPIYPRDRGVRRDRLIC